MPPRRGDVGMTCACDAQRRSCASMCPDTIDCIYKGPSSQCKESVIAMDVWMYGCMNVIHRTCGHDDRSVTSIVQEYHVLRLGANLDTNVAEESPGQFGHQDCQ